MNSGPVHVSEARTARMRTAAASQIPARPLPARAAPQPLRAAQHWPGASPGAMVSHPATGLRPSQVPVAPIQCKPVISSPGGADEREADDLADAVLRMPDRVAAGAARPVLQRKCTGCEEEKEKEKGPVRTKRAPSASSGSVPDTGATVSAAGRGGTPLPPGVRSFFEPRFGRDFTAVRLHTGADAAAGAQAVQARAYTIGNDIVFGAGEFAPATSQGKWLLAHELAHTLQQGGTVPQRKIQRLGANPGCSAAQAADVHQAIFDARGWLDKAIPQLAAKPLPPAVIGSLRRNFGPTYGVAANAALIAGRLAVARHELSTIPIGCAGAGDATCDAGHCGYAVFGSHAATICSNVTLVAGVDMVSRAGCVLHESLHAAFSRFTVDEYSGWHGHSGSTPTYPGAGTDPLLNADSYTSLVMDLS